MTLSGVSRFSGTEYKCKGLQNLKESGFYWTVFGNFPIFKFILIIKTEDTTTQELDWKDPI